MVMLILGGLNVAISFGLAMLLESNVFRRCALERPWSVLGGLLGWLWRSGGESWEVTMLLFCLF